MLSRVCGRASVLAVFGFGSISLLTSACTETDIDPIVVAPKPPATSAPLSQGGPMDVLFVVDDSSSMSDKQQYLGEAAASFLNRLASPACVDANHGVVGTSTDGACTSGQLAYVPVTDIHVGIVSTSLGLGSPNDDAVSGANGSSCANFHAHLVSGTVAGKQPTLDSKTQVFSWTKEQDIAQLAKDVSESVIGMGESGCGIEQQLESWYRFLVQPDPYQSLAWADGSVQNVVYQGTDDDLLAQRKAFLRPNSTVAIVMLTDENDSSIDPLALSGTAWELANPEFMPPNPTSTCATDPTSAACTSCAFVSSSSDPNCAMSPVASAADQPNTRFFHAKQRFGVDPQYPVSRYVTGLSSARVPDRANEHASLPLTGDLGYVGLPSCDNPLFAANLPANSSEDVCNLPHGTRTASQIFFTVIAGVPHQLLQQDPLDANSPLKSNLSAADYRTLLGDDPLAYRFDGVDVHMLESLSPRAGISAGDPIVLGDWNTKGMELQRACTFPLPQPIDESFFNGECSSTPDHASDDAQGDPVCKQDGSQTQLYASATPAVRELSLARALGNQAIVSSICPIHLQIDSADAGTTTSTSISNTSQDPLFGYEPATNQLISRMAGN